MLGIWTVATLGRKRDTRESNLGIFLVEAKDRTQALVRAQLGNAMLNGIIVDMAIAMPLPGMFAMEASVPADPSWEDLKTDSGNGEGR